MFSKRHVVVTDKINEIFLPFWFRHNSTSTPTLPHRGGRNWACNFLFIQSHAKHILWYKLCSMNACDRHAGIGSLYQTGTQFIRPLQNPWALNRLVKFETNFHALITIIIRWVNWKRKQTFVCFIYFISEWVVSRLSRVGKRYLNTVKISSLSSFSMFNTGKNTFSYIQNKTN